MGIELITGMGGTNHVDSEDVGALNAELIGNGNYLLSGCEVTMTDANTCHVAAGELLLQGRHVRIKGAGEDVSIGNGQAGYNQRYLICLVYSKATSGIETVGLQAFAGAKTTGTATDPAVAAGSILGGDTNVVVPLARLELTGLSVGTPAVMLDSVKGLVALGAETKKLGDSVSRAKDYVVEQGVKGDWQYVKWASGRAECSRSMEVSITKTGNYWLPEINLPFAFRKTANSRSRFSIFVSGGDYNAPVLYPKYPVSESTVSKVCCAVMYVTEKGTTTVNYLVRGYWK